MKSILFIAFGVASAGAVAQQSTATDTPAPSAEAQKVIQDCSAHKFETVVVGTSQGKPKKSNVKLCGVKGQSDADWIGTLQDAAAKTAANDKMPPAIREQIVKALMQEIGRLSGVAPTERQATVATAPTSTTPAPTTPVVAAPPPPPRAAPVPQAPARRDYSALPPLPTAPTVPTPSLLAPGAAAASSAAPAIPYLPRPKLSISCYTPGETAGVGPCTEFARATLVTVKAGEDLPAGTGIRFVRDGDKQTDVQLAQLRRGKSLSFELPRDVCRGVGGGRLEMKITRDAPNFGAQVVGSEGPFNLRC